MWLTILLWLNVYVEPGNGSIGCGQVWDSPEGKVDDFLIPDCRKAIDHRRAVLPVPIVVIGVGATLIVLTRNRHRSTEPV